MGPEKEASYRKSLGGSQGFSCAKTMPAAVHTGRNWFDSPYIPLGFKSSVIMPIMWNSGSVLDSAPGKPQRCCGDIAPPTAIESGSEKV